MEIGTYTETEQEKVDILNEFVSSIFTKEDEASVPLINKQFSGSVLIDLDGLQNKWYQKHYDR